MSDFITKLTNINPVIGIGNYPVTLKLIQNVTHRKSRYIFILIIQPIAENLSSHSILKL